MHLHHSSIFFITYHNFMVWNNSPYSTAIAVYSAQAPWETPGAITHASVSGRQGAGKQPCYMVDGNWSKFEAFWNVLIWFLNLFDKSFLC